MEKLIILTQTKIYSVSQKTSCLFLKTYDDLNINVIYVIEIIKKCVIFILLKF